MDLRGKRLEQGLTMEQLAEQCTAAGTRVSASEISRIERGIHIPRPALRKRLAELLGVTVADLGDRLPVIARDAISPPALECHAVRASTCTCQTECPFDRPPQAQTTTDA